MAIKVDGVAVTGMAAGWPAAQELEPEALTDLYRGFFDLSVLWPTRTSSIGTAGVVTIARGGYGYTDGQALLVPLLGGKGSGAQATLDFSGGYLTNVTVTTEGANYYEGDLLHFDNAAAGQPAGAGGGLIQVIGLGVQRDGAVQVKAQAKPQAQPMGDVEAYIAKASRKQLEEFIVQFQLGSADGTAGINPKDFPQLAVLREAVTEAWKLMEANK